MPRRNYLIDMKQHEDTNYICSYLRFYFILGTITPISYNNKITNRLDIALSNIITIFDLFTVCDRPVYMVGKLACVATPHMFLSLRAMFTYPSIPQLLPQLKITKK